MRLLEPLNGIKMGQGHYIIHLYFFITMCLIPTDLNIDLTSWLPADVAKHAEEARAASEELAKKAEEKAKREEAKKAAAEAAKKAEEDAKKPKEEEATEEEGDDTETGGDYDVVKDVTDKTKEHAGDEYDAVKDASEKTKETKDALSDHDILMYGEAPGYWQPVSNFKTGLPELQSMFQDGWVNMKTM